MPTNNKPYPGYFSIEEWNRIKDKKHSDDEQFRKFLKKLPNKFDASECEWVGDFVKVPVRWSDSTEKDYAYFNPKLIMAYNGAENGEDTIVRGMDYSYRILMPIEEFNKLINSKDKR